MTDRLTDILYSLLLGNRSVRIKTTTQIFEAQLDWSRQILLLQKGHPLRLRRWPEQLAVCWKLLLARILLRFSCLRSGDPCYAHRILGSTGGKHCESLQRNVWRNVVFPTKAVSGRTITHFRRDFVRRGGD